MLKNEIPTTMCQVSVTDAETHEIWFLFGSTDEKEILCTEERTHIRVT